MRPRLPASPLTRGKANMKSIYKQNSGTAHNSALPGDLAPTVLMPGDPLRARYIAESFLEESRCVNEIRGMLAYTGSFAGKTVSVMGSGMGGPSMGIYSYELFSHYGVRRIIRLGTCGGLLPDVRVGDILMALCASSDSNYALQYGLAGHYSPSCDFHLLERAVSASRELGIEPRVGNILSSDLFSPYDARGDKNWKNWAAMGCAATDMETYALYCNAAHLGGTALTILTCSDSNVTGHSLSPKERQSSLETMIRIGLTFAGP